MYSFLLLYFSFHLTFFHFFFFVLICCVWSLVLDFDWWQDLKHFIIMTTAFERPSESNFFFPNLHSWTDEDNTTPLEDLMLKARHIMIMISSAYVLYFKRGPYWHILDSGMNAYKLLRTSHLCQLFNCNLNRKPITVSSFWYITNKHLWHFFSLKINISFSWPYSKVVCANFFSFQPYL